MGVVLSGISVPPLRVPASSRQRLAAPLCAVTACFSAVGGARARHNANEQRRAKKFKDALDTLRALMEVR